MVKYENNEVGIDINDFDANYLSSCLPLGRLGKGERLGAAITNEKFIMETAQMLRFLSDFDLEVNREKPEKRKQSGQHISSCLKKIIETLDIVLNWLEQSAMKSKNATEKQNEEKEQNPDKCQKKETVLRGLYHITGKAYSELIRTITKTLLVTGFTKLHAFSVMPIESHKHCQ